MGRPACGSSSRCWGHRPGTCARGRAFRACRRPLPTCRGKRGVGQLGAVVAAFVAKDAGERKLARVLRARPAPAARPRCARCWRTKFFSRGSGCAANSWMASLKALHHIGELVTVQAGERDHGVDARAPQLLQGNHLHATTPALVPARPGAHGVEDLRLQHAQVAQGFRCSTC